VLDVVEGVVRGRVVGRGERHAGDEEHREDDSARG
jgi:hypothetical protein